jgi:hypothetical protein
MTTGNGVPPTSDNGEDNDDARRDDGHGRDGSSELRDIEELVAKLQSVTRQLEFHGRIPAQPYPWELQ